MIAIIDYGMGNLSSVKRKMDRIRINSVITSQQDEIRKCDKIVLPGVGHFGKAMSEIKKRGLFDLLSEQVLIKNKPVLGICLGMQLMANGSEEGDAEGFGWINARVIRFNVSDRIKFKIPHTGWNTLTKIKQSPLIDNLISNSEFYFVHSYHLQCNDPDDILAETIYDYPFTSVFQKGNIYGVQFHPEKSHDAGELLLRNFVNF
jgi:glutamine amidotransferase